MKRIAIISLLIIFILPSLSFALKKSQEIDHAAYLFTNDSLFISPDTELYYENLAYTDYETVIDTSADQDQEYHPDDESLIMTPPVTPHNKAKQKQTVNYTERIPQRIETTEKVIVVDPRVHVWAAYDENGKLVRAGLATAGGKRCSDSNAMCGTKAGEFRIKSLGNPGCRSSKYPRPYGGAPMPYCMFFNGGQALHGSPKNAVIEGNVSHGCVRMHIEDAGWLRYNFATVGTKVIVKPY